MGEIIRSNDLVLLSYAQALLKDAGIAFFVADLNTGFAEGSISALLPRLLVDREDEAQARRVLIEAGLEAELRSHG